MSSKTAPTGPAADRDEALARLLDEIEANPRIHDFFATLRRIESLRPDAPRWGRAARPSQEPLRLSQDAELDFAPAAVSSFDRGRATPRLGVRFFGLFGSQGPLPLHLTEYVRERTRLHGDPTLARFCDVFHHRLLTFFYRAWAEAQPVVHLDRPATDRHAAWLGSAFGFEREALDGGPLPDAGRLFQTGLLSGRSRHAEGLVKVLSSYFKVPVAIEEHVAHWMPVDVADRSRLGFARNRAERFHLERAELGVTAVGGSKVYDRQFNFRIVLGPLTLERYLAFVPDGAAWPALAAWVGQYVGVDLRWDVELVLDRREVPKARLGRGLRLGLTTWIGRGHRTRHRADLHLRPTSSSLIDRPRPHA